jgi:TonB-dependent receptor
MAIKNNSSSRKVIGGDVRDVAGIRYSLWLAALACSLFAGQLFAQNVGSVRISVKDQDWQVPINDAQVTLVEKNLKQATNPEGQALFENLESGRYTFSVGTAGFERKVISGVVVIEGKVEVVECTLQASYTDMEEFVIKDLDLASMGSDIQLLEIRAQTPRMMDAIGSDMLSKAGASTAAGALRLVTGATIQDGKYAVIRGLGDRYTSTSINAVRLPNADRDKRAVSLDQFPSAMIEGVQVSKTFLPDQQGDATGGINITTKSVPEKTILQASTSAEYDSNATGNGDFLSYRGGGNNFDGRRGVTSLEFYDNKTGKYPRGGSESMTPKHDAPPMNYGFKFAVGDFIDWDEWRFGGMLIGSYSQKYKYWDGRQYSLDADRSTLKTLKIDREDDEKFSYSQDDQLWSGGLILGAKNDYNRLQFMTLYTHQSKDTVLVRQTTPREVESSLDADDIRYENWRNPATGRWERREVRTPLKRGLRQESTQDFSLLERYTENANATMQLSGEHTLSLLNDGVFDWNVSYNMAESVEPDRRRIKGSYITREERWQDYQSGVAGPEQNSASTNMQSFAASRRYQDTREDGLQWQINYKQPYSVAEGWDGYVKAGFFMDCVERAYRNRNYIGEADVNVPATAPDRFTDLGKAIDKVEFPFDTSSIQYDGKQDINAWYLMAKAPLPEWLEVIGGARMESTYLSTQVKRSPGGGDDSKSLKIYEKIDQKYIDRATEENEDNPAFDPTFLNQRYGMIGFTTREEGDGDTEIEQVDLLPAGTIALRPLEGVTLRFSYSETIARPIFKEITPIVYDDFDDNRVFLGNPDLEISRLRNYDLRLEWRPDPKAADLIAASVFYKTISDPIQYSVRIEADNVSSPDYIYPENYGDAEIKGIELEARKSLGFISDYVKDLTLGGNLTLQESEVEYIEDLQAQLREKGVKSKTRPMDGQSDILANVNMMYENEDIGLSLGIFYNFRGETYVAGDTANTYSYIPAIIEEPVGTLDFTIGYKFRFSENPYSPVWRLGLEFKNLLDPEIETTYRTPDKDFPRSSYRAGRTYGISLGCTW